MVINFISINILKKKLRSPELGRETWDFSQKADIKVHVFEIVHPLYKGREACGI